MQRLALLATTLLALGSAAHAQSVVEFLLIDADAESVIGPLTDGQTIYVADLPTTNFNVQAVTNPPTVGSVRFYVDGSLARNENVAPYTFAGDYQGDFYSWSPTPGEHNLSAIAFSGASGSGTASPPAMISIEFDFTSPGEGIPIVDAGPDLFPLGSQDSVTLPGTVVATDGSSIDSIAWSQLEGPAASLSGATTETLTASGLMPDTVYRFELTAWSTTGMSQSDDVVVTVGPVTGATITGELETWHKITLTFPGPGANETGGFNPFLDARFDVTFSQGGRQFVVPGHFAADANASESSATGGDRWRVHFCPDEPGEWSYVTSFRTGAGVAVSTNPFAGLPDDQLHDLTGTFTVASSTKTSPDLRALGRLEYDGTRFLHFADGTPFVKGGANSPENLLAYDDFDGTYTLTGSFLHEYAPHVNDWSAGDPQWQGTRGRGLIGAMNYLASKGMNCVYFMTLTLDGDGDDVWPWISPSSSNRLRYDVSKLDQWEIVFEHMTRRGLVLHMVMQETENGDLLDGGLLQTERRLYYRELISRFGHHPGLIWNLGEENLNSEQERRDFAQYFEDHDPYDHPVTVHTYPQQQDLIWGPLIGLPTFDVGSLQSPVDEVHQKTLTWIENSAAAGQPWAIFIDEIGSATIGALPDSVDPDHDSIRHQALWGNLMAGGGGAEWYFGYGYDHDDLDCEDWRTRENLWEQTAHALDFFRNHVPITELEAFDALTTDSNDYAMRHPNGELFVVYRPNGGTTQAVLPAGGYDVDWFDPKNGGALQSGGTINSNGSSPVSIGPAPSSGDWAARLTRTGTVEPAIVFQRGDINEDGAVDFSDAIAEILILFSEAPSPSCYKVRDTNDDGSLNLADVMFLLSALLESGAPPVPAPSPACGEDPTEDTLPCDTTSCP